MVKRGAINRGSSAARIIGDHTAQRRSRAGGHVRPEAKSVRTQEFIQIIQDHAGPYPDRTPLQIKIDNLAIVAREIDDQAITDSTADQARSGAARNYTDPRLG